MKSSDPRLNSLYCTGNCSVKSVDYGAQSYDWLNELMLKPNPAAPTKHQQNSARNVAIHLVNRYHTK